MKRRSFFFAVSAMLLASPTLLQAQSSAQQEMQFAQFFVGTWSCKHTVGDFSGTYTTTIANSLGDRWLKQTYDFPTLGDSSGPAHAEYFIGYDPRNQSWLRLGRHD